MLDLIEFEGVIATRADWKFICDLLQRKRRIAERVSVSQSLVFRRLDRRAVGRPRPVVFKAAFSPDIGEVL